MSFPFSFSICKNLFTDMLLLITSAILGRFNFSFNCSNSYQDCSFLRFLFDNRKYNSPSFILSGPGGDFIPGVLFPKIIKTNVKSYDVIIPRICGSSLCYTIFKADRLLVTENSYLSQIDPTFEYGQENLRAIKIMKQDIEDIKLKEYARDVFHLAEKFVMEYCKYPSLFRSEKDEEYLEFCQLDDLATLFMNKEEHESQITLKELIGLGAKIKFIDDKEIEHLLNQLIMDCQDLAIDKDVRVIFVTSNPIKIEKEGEGFFICPLT